MYELSLTPEEQLEEILAEVLAMEELNGNVANSLAAKLENILAKPASGKTGPALNQLNAIINQIEALIQSGCLEEPDGQALIDVAQGVIAELSFVGPGPAIAGRPGRHGRRSGRGSPIRSVNGPGGVSAEAGRGCPG